MTALSIFLYTSIGYVALTSFFYLLAFFSVPRTAFAARSLASYGSLLVCAAYGTVASLILVVVGQQRIAQWATARSFHFVMGLTTGIIFSVRDPKQYLTTTRPAVFVGNHQTELDVLMLGAIFPRYCSITAKSTLKTVPFLGWFMALSGAIFIDRKSSKDARDAMKGAAKEIREKRQSVYMFPEGTRSYAQDATLLPFKKGAFYLAIEAGAPIVPVVVANYSHVLNSKKMIFTSGSIPVQVLEPIPTKGLTSADVDDLLKETRDKIMEELIKLTAEVKGQSNPAAIPHKPTKAIASGVDI